MSEVETMPRSFVVETRHVASKKFGKADISFLNESRDEMRHFQNTSIGEPRLSLHAGFRRDMSRLYNAVTGMDNCDE